MSHQELIKPTLFVCRNNVARSQLAAGYMNRIHPGFGVSAGTDVETRGGYVEDWEDPEVEKFVWLAAADGLDIARNERTPLDEDTLRGIGRVILIDLQAVEELEDRRGTPLPWPGTPEVWNVPDPHHLPKEECADIRSIIKAKVAELATRSTIIGADGSGPQAYMARLF